MLYTISSKLTNIYERFDEFLVKYIAETKITSVTELDRVISYVKKIPPNVNEINKEEFEKDCGIGVVVTLE